MDDKNENPCRNHRILHQIPLECILWAIGNNVGIKRLTFLDVLFLKDHYGSSIENWLEVRQVPGNRKAGDRQ